MSINILDQNTINKIAAGEVVERPASVVKELIENAIDAGALAITVEIKEGGISFIRITDNGCGIPKEDIRTAFLRHSTSKIKDAADLMNISSLGFRGEALSSISAVAQVELITKTADSLTGIRYEIDGGKEKNFEEVGAPDGTTFIVRNLFYNTPARRKFLKTPATEGGYISSIIEHLCLSRPDISFRLIINNQPKIQTTGNGRLMDVIYTIYGRETAAGLIEVDSDFGTFSVKGFIGKPSVCRGNRNFENYYINGRYIKSNIIAKAVEEAYAPFIMQHKYPFLTLHIKINPKLLDVNVHPSKMELRFANAPFLYDSLKECITKALTHRELIPAATLNDSAKDDYRAPAVKPLVTSTYSFTEAPAKPKDYTPSKPLSGHHEDGQAPLVLAPKEPEIKSQPVRMPEPFETKRSAVYQEEQQKNNITNEYKQLELFDKPELLHSDNMKDIRIVGQVFDTYWIMEFDKNMYIVDQHAAHEKVLFEKFMKNYGENNVTTQYLSPPVIFSLTLQEQDILNDNLGYFNDFGFEIESFGGDEYALRGIPAAFTNADPKDLLLEILDELSQDVKKNTPDTIKDKIATMSCKAAVKGNNKLSYAEMENLLRSLMELDNPYNCPHGRPTMITMSKYELEKKFKRII